MSIFKMTDNKWTKGLLWLIASLALCACHAPIPKRAPASDVPFAYRMSDFIAFHKNGVRIFHTLIPSKQEFELNSKRRSNERFSVEAFFPGFEALILERLDRDGTEAILGGRDLETGWMRVICLDLDGATDDDLSNYLTEDRLFPGLHPPQALNPWAEGLERTWMIESVTGDVHLVNLNTGEHQQVVDGRRDANLLLCTYVYLEEFSQTKDGKEVPLIAITASTAAWQSDARIPSEGGACAMFWHDYESTVE